MKTWLALLLLSFCILRVDAAGIVAEPFPPAKLKSFYAEYDEKGRSISVVMDGDALIYKVTASDGKVEEIATSHPTGDDWFTFFTAINKAMVYKWAPKYYYPGRGASWAFIFAMDDRKFSSEGVNDFPKNGDVENPQADPKAGTSIPFDLYWNAVLTLCGKAKPGAEGK